MKVLVVLLALLVSSLPGSPAHAHGSVDSPEASKRRRRLGKAWGFASELLAEAP